MEESLIFRLKERAKIRRQIKTRKSVQEGKPDRIADLLEEAANEINILRIAMGKVCDYAECGYFGEVIEILEEALEKGN